MPNTIDNERNVDYDRRQRAGKLLIEAPKGAVFQYEADKNVWLPCSARSAASFIMLGHDVRIAPTPKKVLRPVGEIIDEAIRRKQLTVAQNVVSIIDNRGLVWYIGDLITQAVVKDNAPDWFFTSKESPGD